MSAPVPRRPDFDASLRRRLARQSRDPNQTRRLLSPARMALAEIYPFDKLMRRPTLQCGPDLGLRIVRDPQHCRFMRTGTRRTRNHQRRPA